MKKLAWALGGLFALALIPLVASAADDAKTLTGEPVEIGCYLAGRSGEGHASCAVTCITGGAVAGFVTKVDGKNVLYLALAPRGKKIVDVLGDHMGKQVKATGKVVEKEGLRIITIDEISSGD